MGAKAPTLGWLCCVLWFYGSVCNLASAILELRDLEATHAKTLTLSGSAVGRPTDVAVAQAEYKKKKFSLIFQAINAICNAPVCCGIDDSVSFVDLEHLIRMLRYVPLPLPFCWWQLPLSLINKSGPFLTPRQYALLGFLGCFPRLLAFSLSK